MGSKKKKNWRGINSCRREIKEKVKRNEDKRKTLCLKFVQREQYKVVKAVNLVLSSYWTRRHYGGVKFDALPKPLWSATQRPFFQKTSNEGQCSRSSCWARLIFFAG